jgi:hypothetical protein
MKDFPDQFRRRGKTIGVELWYPGLGENATHVEVGLQHVRAADSVRISYDFERDGWKIEQASVFEWEADDTVCDPDWQEVAFVGAWARQESEDMRKELEE